MFEYVAHGILVTSDSPNAEPMAAEAIAKVFSQYQLEGCSDTDVISTTVDYDNGNSVLYLSKLLNS